MQKHNYKRLFKLTLLAAIVLSPAFLYPETANLLNDRIVSVGFQGRLTDENDLSYNGKVNIEAWIYRSFNRIEANLVYAERFADISVENGLFEISIFKGLPLRNAFSLETISKETQLYADIKVNDLSVLEGWPLGSQLAAIRSERVQKADIIRGPIEIPPGAIPRHSASLITTGLLDVARIPSIPAGRITKGAFSAETVPSFDSNKVTSGTFGKDAFGNDIDAGLFSIGTLSDILIPSEFIRKDGIGWIIGSVSHGQAVSVPAGFSRSQCYWQVYVGSINAEPNEGIDHVQLLTDQNGVVTCLWDHITETPYDHECRANYITICRK